MSISDERLAELAHKYERKAATPWLSPRPEITQEDSDIAAALRELQSCRRDAERYRKLRDSGQCGPFVAVWGPYGAADKVTGIRADLAADNAPALPDSSR